MKVKLSNIKRQTEFGLNTSPFPLDHMGLIWLIEHL